MRSVHDVSEKTVTQPFIYILTSSKSVTYSVKGFNRTRPFWRNVSHAFKIRYGSIYLYTHFLQKRDDEAVRRLLSLSAKEATAFRVSGHGRLWRLMVCIFYKKSVNGQCPIITIYYRRIIYYSLIGLIIKTSMDGL